MADTVQRPIDEILAGLDGSAEVFIIGCGCCATRCETGGEAQVEEMKARLEAAGITVAGVAVPADGAPLCAEDNARQLMAAEGPRADGAGTVLILACERGVGMISDLSDPAAVRRGCVTLP